MLKTIGRTVIVLWSLLFVLFMLNNRRPESGVIYVNDDLTDDDVFYLQYHRPSEATRLAVEEDGAGFGTNHQSAMDKDQFDHLTFKVH
jgi:hypothetical protein